MNRVLFALFSLVAAVSASKPVVNAHSTEEGKAMAQDLLNDAMTRMGQTPEGAKKMAADPSMYKRYSDSNSGERKLEAAQVSRGKANMRAYSPEQGRIKGAQVMAERKARKAKLAAQQ